MAAGGFGRSRWRCGKVVVEPIAQIFASEKRVSVLKEKVRAGAGPCPLTGRGPYHMQPLPVVRNGVLHFPELEIASSRHWMS